MNKSINLKDGTLWHGDVLDVMKTFPDESIQTVVTSPPYNLGNSVTRFDTSSKGFWPNALIAHGYTDHSDNMPHDDYVKWQRQCLTEMMRILKPDGCIWYNHKWRCQNLLLQDRADIVEGFPVRQIIIWHLPLSHNWSQRFLNPNYEVIYLICKRDFKLEPGTNEMGAVWKIPQEKRNPHPAPFPAEIPRRCIKAVKNGTVLDPFMGSGTTAVVARELGREFIGIDNSQEYINQALDRLGEKRMEEFVTDPNQM